MNSEHESRPASTWESRRLFRDFRGLIAEETTVAPLPAPEELPIPVEDMMFGEATLALAQMLPESEARKALQRRNLVAAGYLSRASWINLTALRFVLAAGAMLMLGILLIMVPPVVEPYIIGSLVLVPLLLWALPPLIVVARAGTRVFDIERGLPDVLDMLNMCVSQGLTIQQSLKRIAQELRFVHPALCSELIIVSRQATVGSLPAALKSFGQRIESPEVSSFTSLLIQSEATGTAVSRSLSEYSESIRATLKERADTRANAASFQLLFPVSLLLMPSVFLFLLGPAIVQISDFYDTQSESLLRNQRNAAQLLDQEAPRAGTEAQQAQ